MAVAFVASVIAGGSGSAGVTSGAINTTGATLIVLSITAYTGTTPTPTVSDSKGNTWVGLTQKSTTTPITNRLFYCANPTVGSGHTFTIGGSTIFGGIAAAAFSGTLASPYLTENGATSGASSVTTIQPGSVTPSQDNCLIIAGMNANSLASQPSISGGFTALSLAGSSGNYGAFGIAYLIQTSAAAANPSWTWTTAQEANATIAVFKGPAVASGGLFLPAALSGLGSGGPFHANPIG